MPKGPVRLKLTELRRLAATGAADASDARYRATMVVARLGYRF